MDVDCTFYIRSSRTVINDRKVKTRVSSCIRLLVFVTAGSNCNGTVLLSIERISVGRLVLVNEILGRTTNATVVIISQRLGIETCQR